MAVKKTTIGFSAEEKAAMKERADELKAQAKGSDGEADVLAKIAEMRLFAVEGVVPVGASMAG